MGLRSALSSLAAALLPIVIGLIWYCSLSTPSPPELLSLPPAPPLHRSPGIWQTLFNRRDLTGWRHLAGGRVAVREGLLVLESDDARRPGYLISELTAQDFVARFRCRAEHGDSGFFYRSRIDPRTPTTIMGPQVQLNRDPERHLGGIYETQGRGWVAFPFGPVPFPGSGSGQIGWLDGEIMANGDDVRVAINGLTTVDFKDASGANAFQRAGFFALQIHGGGAGRIAFERIEVRVLD